MGGDAVRVRLLLAACVLAAGQDLRDQVTDIDMAEGEYFEARCGASVGATSWRFPVRPMRFRSVTFCGCELPAASYAAAMLAINVTVTEQLRVLQIPSTARLSHTSLAGLPPSLDSLELRAVGAPRASARFLDPLSGLRSLSLERLLPDRLSPRLDVLQLIDTGIIVLPPEALTVVDLQVSESKLMSVSNSQSLSLRGCPRLRSLTLERVPELPEAFSAACGALSALAVRGLRARLPRGLLRNATQLVTFEAAECDFPSLPTDLFAYSPKLRSINLTDIGLKLLPSELFSNLEHLELVTLAGNRLRAHDLAAIARAASLRHLDLSRNPLGDLCPSTREQSLLSGLERLEVLELSGTGLSRVCGDWLRALRALRALNVSHNAVRALSCADLRGQFALNLSYVDLSANPLVRVYCTREDYELTDDEPTIAPVSKPMVQITLDSQLQCDCDAYWVARVLRDRALRAQFEPRCAGPATGNTTNAGAIYRGLLVRKAPLGALLCPLAAEACAPGCACEHSPHLGGVRARCSRGPAVPVGELETAAQSRGLHLVEMRAPSAGVLHLPSQFPPALQLLELDNNSITRASSNSVAVLFEGGRRVRLTRNPLICNCSNVPLLDALRTHQHLVIEYEKTLCADGRQLGAVTDALMCYKTTRSEALGPGLAAGGALVGVVLAGVLAMILSQSKTRHQLKAVLYARGVRLRWLTRRLEPADADRPFDAFIAHAEEDERFVAEKLVMRLEPERRLCLAYREWPAGAWIPAQIEESVRRSRRTLCVISRHFLSSHWARAQLRAAHAHALQDYTPRLVLVLLNVTTDDLDEEMLAALHAHKPLRWGEPCFWEKLTYTLPDPRPQFNEEPEISVIPVGR